MIMNDGGPLQEVVTAGQPPSRGPCRGRAFGPVRPGLPALVPSRLGGWGVYRTPTEDPSQVADELGGNQGTLPIRQRQHCSQRGAHGNDSAYVPVAYR